MRRACILAAFLAAWPLGTAAKLRPKRVVIMGPDSPVVARLRAELAALGWTTSTMAARDSHLDLIGLHARMTDMRATAAIALLPSDDKAGGLAVWIVDDVGMVVSQEQFEPNASLELVALRTVERLRAYRIKVKTQAPATTKQPMKRPPPQPRPQLDDPELQLKRASRSTTGMPGALHISSGLAVGWAPGGLSPTGQLRMGASWVPLEWLAVDLVLLVPVVPAYASAESGETDIYLGLAGAAVRWLGGTRSAWVRPSLGVGMGAMAIHLRGHSTDRKFSSNREWVACAVPFLEGGLVVRLIGHLRLISSLMVGFATPRLVLQYFGAETALDTPLLTGTVGLDLEFL